MFPKMRLIDVDALSNLNCMKCETGVRRSTEPTLNHTYQRFQTSQETLQPKTYDFSTPLSPCTSSKGYSRSLPHVSPN